MTVPPKVSAPATKLKRDLYRWLARSKLTWLVLSVVTAVVFWLFTSLAAQPASLPSQLAVSGDDTAVLGTKEDLNKGISVVVPCSKADQQTDILAMAPFEVKDKPANPSDTCQAPDAAKERFYVTPPYTAKLLLKTSRDIEVGEYVAAIVTVDGAQRKIMVNVTDPPQLTVLAIILGLGISYIASSWLSSRRDVEVLVASAHEAYAYASLIDGDVNNDGHADYSISLAAAKVAGVGPSPPSKSIVALARHGDVNQAREHLTSLNTFIDDYQAFLDRARSLYQVYEKNVLVFPVTGIVKQVKAVVRPTRRLYLNALEVSDLTEQVKKLQEIYPKIVSEYEAWRSAEDKADQLKGQKLSPEDLIKFKDATGNLDIASGYLFGPEPQERIDDITRCIVLADKALQELLNHYPLQPSVLPPAYAAAEKIGVGVKETAPPPERAQELAQYLRIRIHIADWAFLMVGLLAAIITALEVLYVGKPFGSPWNLLSAVLWGIGVDQGLRGLSAVLSKLGVSIPLNTSTVAANQS